MILQRSLVAAQFGLAVLALAGLVFAPPARGRLLLIPLGSGVPVAAIAVESGARLIGPGPLRGSLIVIGQRVRLVRAAGWRLMMTSAPELLCGRSENGARP